MNAPPSRHCERLEGAWQSLVADRLRLEEFATSIASRPPRNDAKRRCAEAHPTFLLPVEWMRDMLGKSIWGDWRMLYLGTSFAPERWSADDVKLQIRAMRKAGVNLVCMGGSAWPYLEPDHGQHQWDWLDQAIARLHKAEINVVLVAPTASPPPWMFARHPSIVLADETGRPRRFDAPGACCRNAPEYVMLAEAIVREMAARYAETDGVIGWLTDPSIGRFDSARSYSPHTLKAFQDWLVARYESIESLNDAWGCAYRQWSEVQLPDNFFDGLRGASPGHWLAFARFCSDVQVAFHKTQYDLVKAANSDHLVGCVCAGYMEEVDCRKLAAHSDFVSWIPEDVSRDDPDEMSYYLETARSLGEALWVMDFPAGAKTDFVMNELGAQPGRGVLRREAWQAVANGADAVVYERWQSTPTGPCQLDQGIVDHDGKPRRRYREVRKAAAEFLKLSSSLENTAPRVLIALIRDYDTIWSLERLPTAPQFSYQEHFRRCYDAVRRKGHHCDVVSPDIDLSAYKVVIAPALAVITLERAEALREFVKAGGTLVLTAQSGTRTPEGAINRMAPPGPLEALVGATVEEVYPLPLVGELEITFARGEFIAELCTVTQWAEVLKVSGAEVVASTLR